MRERALDGSRACEQLRAVEEQRELVGDRVERLVVLVAEAGAEQVRPDQHVAPEAARADDRDDRDHVGLGEGVEQGERQIPQAALAECVRRQRARAAGPHALQRPERELAVDDRLCVGQHDGHAAELHRARQLREHATAAFGDPQLGREVLQERLQLRPAAAAPAEHDLIQRAAQQHLPRDEHEGDAEDGGEVDETAELGVGEPSSETAGAEVEAGGRAERTRGGDESPENVREVAHHEADGERDARGALEAEEPECRRRRGLSRHQRKRRRPRGDRDELCGNHEGEAEGERCHVGRAELAEAAGAPDPGAGEPADVPHGHRGEPDEVDREEGEQARVDGRRQVDQPQVGEHDRRDGDEGRAVVDAEPRRRGGPRPDGPDQCEVPADGQYSHDRGVDEREKQSTKGARGPEVQRDHHPQGPEGEVNGDQAAEDEEDEEDRAAALALAEEAPEVRRHHGPQERRHEVQAGRQQLERTGIAHAGPTSSPQVGCQQVAAGPHPAPGVLVEIALPHRLCTSCPTAYTARRPAHQPAATGVVQQLHAAACGRAGGPSADRDDLRSPRWHDPCVRSEAGGHGR